MNKTNDFKFNLPAYSDPVDIEDLNDNFRGIDDALMAGLCKKDYTGNNMGSSDPSARKYAWAPWLEIVNNNEFDVVVTDRNAPVESEEATINIAAGQTFRKYINGRYYMNFYVQDQYDVTFKWFTNAETYINESGGGGGGTGTVTSVSVQGGSGSHLTGSGNPIETSGTITINVDEGYSIPSDNEQDAWDGKAADLKAEINSSTYVMTLQLKDSAGNLIGSEKTIDLPLETMVVDGEYDSQTKKIKLELKNGNYVEFSVADLVSGLQTELSASNKLNPDYIAYNASHRAVSDTEKDTWNAKQNAISDLATIRSGAAAGATAVQPSAMQTALDGKQDSLDNTQLAAVNSGIDSNKVGQIGTNQTNILYGLEKIGTNLIKPRDDLPTVVTALPEGLRVQRSNTTSSFAYVKCGTVYLESGKKYALYDATYAPTTKHHYFYVDCGGNGFIELSTPSLTATVQYGTGRTTGTYDIYTRIDANSTVDTISTPIICLESVWKQLEAYTPYGAPNYDLTYLQAEDRAALAEEIDAGAKNMLNFDLTSLKALNTSGTWSGNSYTKNGVTFTYNDSTKTISTYGTSTANNTILYLMNFTPTSGKSFTISGCPSGGSSSGYRFCNMGQTWVNDYGSSDTAVGDGTLKEMAIYISNSGAAVGTSSNPLTWKLMICTKAAFGVSPAFVPYRMNYDALIDFTTAKSVTSTNFFTPNENYEIASTAKIYKQGNHIYGNIVLHRKSGYIPINNTESTGAIKPAYYPAHSLPTPAYLSNSEWSYAVLGYGFISNYAGTGDTIVKATHSEDENKYNYVTIPLNYTY